MEFEETAALARRHGVDRRNHEPPAWARRMAESIAESVASAVFRAVARPAKPAPAPRVAARAAPRALSDPDRLDRLVEQHVAARFSSPAWADALRVEPIEEPEDFIEPPDTLGELNEDEREIINLAAQHGHEGLAAARAAVEEHRALRGLLGTMGGPHRVDRYVASHPAVLAACGRIKIDR